MRRFSDALLLFLLAAPGLVGTRAVRGEAEEAAGARQRCDDRPIRISMPYSRSRSRRRCRRLLARARQTTRSSPRRARGAQPCRLAPWKGRAARAAPNYSLLCGPAMVEACMCDQKFISGQPAALVPVMTTGPRSGESASFWFSSPLEPRHLRRPRPAFFGPLGAARTHRLVLGTARAARLVTNSRCRSHPPSAPSAWRALCGAANCGFSAYSPPIACGAA